MCKNRLQDDDDDPFVTAYWGDQISIFIKVKTFKQIILSRA